MKPGQVGAYGPDTAGGSRVPAVVPRLLALAVVAGLHVALLLWLGGQTLVNQAARPVTPARLILEIRPPPPPPPPPPVPRAAVPPAVFLPVPDIQLATTPPPAPRAPTAMRRGPAVATPDHFGAATESGLGLDLGTLAGGGAGARGSLSGFEAAVRRAVLAGKRQPALAWDRRDTCVVNYAVRVDRGGGLAGLHIDPCAVPEINAAARAAIQGASFPRPPDLGAASYEVHGSLIFRP